RRHDGAVAASLDSGWDPDSPADVEGANRSDLQAHSRWRRGNYKIGRHERVVCAWRCGRGDGRSDPERQKENSSMLRLFAVRVRRTESISWGAGEVRCAGAGTGDRN